MSRGVSWIVIEELFVDISPHSPLSLTDLATFPLPLLAFTHGLTSVPPSCFFFFLKKLQLLAEESVFVLPGQCFFMPNYFRVVFVAPVEKLEVAAARISEFCARHTV